MKSKNRWIILVIILVITNLATLSMLGFYAFWRNFCWKEEVLVMTGYAATLQAEIDFKKGNLRLYELHEGSDGGFSNRMNEPFEIWYWEYFPDFGKPHIQAQTRFVERYNKKMQYMHEHPEEFHFNKGKPILR